LAPEDIPVPAGTFFRFWPRKRSSASPCTDASSAWNQLQMRCACTHVEWCSKNLYSASWCFSHSLLPAGRDPCHAAAVPTPAAAPSTHRPVPWSPTGLLQGAGQHPAEGPDPARSPQPCRGARGSGMPGPPTVLQPYTGSILLLQGCPTGLRRGGRAQGGRSTADRRTAAANAPWVVISGSFTSAPGERGRRGHQRDAGLGCSR